VANEEEKKRPENWRPITLMGAMYRITLWIIANYLQKVNAEHNNRIISIQQKGFIKDIEGCTEHISKISLLLAHAITNKKPIYIAAIDCKDAFGSVTHDILKQNLKRTGLHMNLVYVIMDSYKKLLSEYGIKVKPPISFQLEKE
jgi:hypothetical protein